MRLRADSRLWRAVALALFGLAAATFGWMTAGGASRAWSGLTFNPGAPPARSPRSRRASSSRPCSWDRPFRRLPATLLVLEYAGVPAAPAP